MKLTPEQQALLIELGQQLISGHLEREAAREAARQEHELHVGRFNVASSLMLQIVASQDVHTQSSLERAARLAMLGTVKLEQLVFVGIGDEDDEETDEGAPS